MLILKLLTPLNKSITSKSYYNISTNFKMFKFNSIQFGKYADDNPKTNEALLCSNTRGCNNRKENKRLQLIFTMSPFYLRWFFLFSFIFFIFFCFAFISNSVPQNRPRSPHLPHSVIIWFAYFALYSKHFRRQSMSSPVYTTKFAFKSRWFVSTYHRASNWRWTGGKISWTTYKKVRQS